METTVIESKSMFTAMERNDRQHGSGLRRLAGGLVLGLALTAAAFSAFGASSAGAEGPQTYLSYKLENVRIVSYQMGQHDLPPPDEDCHPSPYISECDEATPTGRELIPPPPVDCHPHPLISVCDLKAKTGDDFEFIPPATPDCNPHPYINVCDLTADDGDDWVQFQRHQAADSFTAEVCKHDTSPDPVSCKPRP